MTPFHFRIFMQPWIYIIGIKINHLLKINHKFAFKQNFHIPHIEFAQIPMGSQSTVQARLFENPEKSTFTVKKDSDPFCKLSSEGTKASLD